MVVNPAYKGIKLPVDQWPLLSNFEPVKYYASDNNDCLFHSPVPYLPLVAAPLANLEGVSESLQFDLANSTTVCSQIDGTATGEKLVALGRQTDGYRFMIGVTPLADDQRYQLRPAALETLTGTYVAPDSASLKASGALLTPNKESGTWLASTSALESGKTAGAAYPGTMVVYAAVPTSGLPAADAHDFAQLLQFAATSGQAPGFGVGQLPPGYLPMTAANGLGSLAAYTLAAAQAVAAQKGELPPLIAPPVTHHHHHQPPVTTTTTVPGSPSSTIPVLTSSGSPQGSSGGGTTPGHAGGRTHTHTTQPASGEVLGITLGIGLGTGDVLVVVLLALAVIGGLGVLTIYAIGRRRQKS
jgi:hypothetical protein